MVETTTTHVSIDVIGDEDACGARIALEVPFGEYVGIGVSKRHPNDEHDPEIGAALALCRALRDAADDLENTAIVRIAGPMLTKRLTTDELLDTFVSRIVGVPLA